MTGRRGKRNNQLLYDFREKKGYCNLKEETLDRTVETSFLKSLSTCLMTDNRIMMRGTFYELKRPGVKLKSREFKVCDSVHLQSLK